NCAGLWAPRLALCTEGLPPSLVPTAHFCKGNYYALTSRSPFSRLVYPLPQSAGLGVHFTLDLGGQGRFGPDVEWLPDPQSEPLDYAVNPSRANDFYAEVRRYWPRLPDDALQPAYSGIRPKIHGPHEPTPDFVIQGPDDHGIAGLVNLFGIESPGLTASLALADEVANRLRPSL
ncbi:MAG TPA: FAD-dependent oxidoreductase, partial [Aquabacterium sp.]|nr:FAD-dependent oxidoreductase [Aquabacterium sp.]